MSSYDIRSLASGELLWVSGQTLELSVFKKFWELGYNLVIKGYKQLL